MFHKIGDAHWADLQAAAAKLAHHEQAYRNAFEILEASIESGIGDQLVLLRRLQKQLASELVITERDLNPQSVKSRRDHYIADVRSFVGDTVLYWRPDGNGYTTDLNDAGLYTKDEAIAKRDTDVPVPMETARRCAVHTVDAQLLREAGVELSPRSRSDKRAAL